MRIRLRQKRSYFGRRDRPAQSFRPLHPDMRENRMLPYNSKQHRRLSRATRVASVKERRLAERRLGIERRRVERRSSGLDPRAVARPDHRAALRRHTHRRMVMNRRSATWFHAPPQQAERRRTQYLARRILVRDPRVNRRGACGPPASHRPAPRA